MRLQHRRHYDLTPQPHLLRLLIPLGVSVVFALDKGVNVRKDKNIRTLCRFTRVSAITDAQNLLEDKMAPVDRGREVWQTLCNRKTLIEG